MDHEMNDETDQLPTIPGQDQRSVLIKQEPTDHNAQDDSTKNVRQTESITPQSDHANQQAKDGPQETNLNMEQDGVNTNDNSVLPNSDELDVVVKTEDEKTQGEHTKNSVEERVTNEEEDDEDEDDEEDEEEEEDEITITINEVKPTAPTSFSYAPVNLNITKRAAAFGPTGQVTATAASTTKQKAGLDIETVGQYDGQSIYDLNLDTLEDKPWRKPGADITDYFNYGFNEDTWKIYCERQKRLRNDNGLETDALERNERNDRDRRPDRVDRGRGDMSNSGNSMIREMGSGNNIVLRTFVPPHHRERERDFHPHSNYGGGMHNNANSGNIVNNPNLHTLSGMSAASSTTSSASSGNGPHLGLPNSKIEGGPGGPGILGPSINENSKYAAGALGVKKAGPPPGRKICGAIEVIGAGAQAVPGVGVSSPISTGPPVNLPGSGAGPHLLRGRPDMKDSGGYMQHMSGPSNNAYGIPYGMDFQGGGLDMHPMNFGGGNGPNDYMNNPPPRFDMGGGGPGIPMEPPPPFENEMYRDDSDDRNRDYSYGRNSANSGRGHMGRDYGRDDGNYRGRTVPSSSSSGYRGGDGGYAEKDRTRDKDRDSGSSSRRRERERSERDRDREKRRKT